MLILWFLGKEGTKRFGELKAYYVEPERGEWFFSPKYREGAEYWVSWENHGEFLFHSVPFNKDKKVIEKEAKNYEKKLPMDASGLRFQMQNGFMKTYLKKQK